MSFVITGATGQLGRLTVEALLQRGVPASEIVAAGRNEEKLARLAELGVRTLRIDYTEPDTLAKAFSAGDTVLLISSSEVGKRAAQHAAVIDASKAAGIARLVYTSAPGATSSALILAPEHKVTEEAIHASGLPFTILRNGWYTENYLGEVANGREKGEIVTSTDDGRVSSASRQDYAEAAAVALTTEGHEGKTYELSGDVAWNFDELAQTVSEIVGAPVAHRRLSSDEHIAALVSAGVPEGGAGFAVGLQGNIRDGLLGATSGELRTLIGRPTTPLAEGLRSALA